MALLRNAISIALVSVLMSGCAVQNSEKSESNGASPAQVRAGGKAYQATYSAPGNFAYQTEHFYSDGAGHFRIDISGQGPVVVHVLDLNTNETTMWAEGSNVFTRRPSQPMDPLVMRVHMQEMPKSGAESLGARTINGHKCHGWRASGTEVWFDDDYGCHVTATAGGITSTLTEFSGTAPDPSVFQPPPGYTQAANRQPMRNSFRSDRSRIMNDVQRHMR